MPVITLPDGSQRSFEQAVSVMDVALDIGPGLAKATIAGRIDGTQNWPAQAATSLRPTASIAPTIMAFMKPATAIAVG